MYLLHILESAFAWMFSNAERIIAVSSGLASITSLVLQVYSMRKDKKKPVSTRKSRKIKPMETKSLNHFSRNHFHFSFFVLPELLLSTYRLTTKSLVEKQNKMTKTKKKVSAKKVGNKAGNKKATPKKTATKKAVVKDEAKEAKEEKKEKQIQNRDTTTYKFQGEEYGKGPFVLAVIQHYVKHHPKCTEAQLKEIFPDNIIGRYGVFTDLKTALNKSKTSGKKRYFTNETQLIRLGNKDYAVTNQWTAKLMDKFLAALKEHGLKTAK
jgi:hypothetical protein